MTNSNNDHFLSPETDYTMHNYNNNPDELTVLICSQLETVFDPEFPLVDIFTLGLIYSIVVNSDDHQIDIIMTYTTPSCPDGELIQELIKNAITDKLPEYTIDIQVTFDPQRSMDMIRDQDLRRIFE